MNKKINRELFKTI